MTPPEVKTGLKLQDIPLHDPWMLADRSTRTYYLYSSASPRITGQGRTGTLYYTSKDLATWEGPRIAFVAPESSWADPKVGAWAPEVHAYKGKYYLFTTLHNPAKKLTTTDTTRPNQMRATRSKSGELKGPWEQLSPLVGNDSGHGMLFRSFDGKLMLVVHQPFGNARGKLYEMEDAGDGLRVVRYREDFSGRRCRRCRGRRRGGRDRSGSLA